MKKSKESKAPVTAELEEYKALYQTKNLQVYRLKMKLRDALFHAKRGRDCGKCSYCSDVERILADEAVSEKEI